MKRPFALCVVGADFAFISACAEGGTVPEGIPAGDEAADQARIATELSVELAATESPTSIEEVMPRPRRPSTPKDPERHAKGGRMATTNGVDIVVKSCPQICFPRHGSPSQGRDQQEHNWQTAERGSARWINFAPRSEAFQGTTYSK